MALGPLRSDDRRAVSGMSRTRTLKMAGEADGVRRAASLANDGSEIRSAVEE